MTVPNLLLVPELDLCLTGHNHIFHYEKVNGVSIVEGGINLEKVAVIDMSFVPHTKPLIRQEKVSYLPLDDSIPEDPKMKQVTQKYLNEFNEKGKVEIGKTSVLLNCQNNAGTLLFGALAYNTSKIKRDQYR